MSKQQPTKNGESKGNRENGRRPRRPSPRSMARNEALPSPLASEGAENVIDALFDLDGVDEDIERLLRAELGRIHGLGNLPPKHLDYRFYKLKNSDEILQAHFPPVESLWQGELRKEAGLKDAREPLTPEMRFNIRSAVDAAYSVVSRSGPEEGGFQQKLLAQQQAERREIVERDDGRNKGWFSRLLG